MTRCPARFKLSQSDRARVWCMLDQGHDGRHWVQGARYELRWDSDA